MLAGDVWERAVEQALGLLSERELVFWHRFFDRASSKGAATYVSDQPSDYLVATTDGVTLLEAKASDNRTTPDKGCMQSSQRNAISRWRLLNGQPYCVLFWSMVTGEAHLYDGLVFLRKDRGLNKTPISSYRVSCPNTGKIDIERLYQFLRIAFPGDKAAQMKMALAKQAELEGKLP